MTKFDKVIRVLGIIAIAGLLFVWLDSCAVKKEETRMDTESKLIIMAEELHSIRELCDEVYGGTYYDMEEALYDISTRCDELIKTTEELANRYKEVEVEEKKIPNF